MIKKNESIQFILTAVVMLLLMVASALFPPLLFTLCIPLGVFAFTKENAVSVALLALVSVVLVFLLDGGSALLYFAMGLTVIFYLVPQIKRRTVPWKVIMLFATLLCSIAVVYGIFVQRQTGQVLWDEVTSVITQVTENQLEMLKESGLPNIQEMNLEFQIRQATQRLTNLFPAFIVLLCATVAFVHYYMLTAILHARGYVIMKAQRLPRFSLPQNFVIGAVLSVGVSFLMGPLGYPHATTLQENLWMIFSFFLAMQGVAVVDFLLRRRINVIARWVIIGLVTAFLQGYMLWVFIGMIDIPIRIRERYERYINKENS